MPDTEITRAETRERARLLRVRSYHVDLDFTRGPETFGSVSLIRFDCHQPGAATHADLIATGVREIMLNGVPLDPQTTWANGRITLPGLAGRNELRIAADCAYTTSGTGMKAVFTFQVTAPDQWAVLSRRASSSRSSRIRARRRIARPTGDPAGAVSRRVSRVAGRQ